MWQERIGETDRFRVRFRREELTALEGYGIDNNLKSILDTVDLVEKTLHFVG